jgi:hypothetical protein
MGRPKTAVRISLKGKNGKTVRIGLAAQADGRWAVYRDGARSQRVPSANSTQIAGLISKWLQTQGTNT